MSRYVEAMREIGHRLWLALTIILWGRMENGALDHLRIVMTELRFIEEHINDMTKDEMGALIIGDDSKPQTGLIHHVAHAQISDIWRVLSAAEVEVKLIQLKVNTVSEIKKIVANRG